MWHISQDRVMSPWLCRDVQKPRTWCSACSWTHQGRNGLHHQTTGLYKWWGTVAQTEKSPDRIHISTTC